MKLKIATAFFGIAMVFVVGQVNGVRLLQAGAQNDEVQAHLDNARDAAYRPGQDLSWVYDRLCFEPAPQPARAQAVAAEVAPERQGPPPQSVWYDEPAKVFDNLYYLGTKTASVAEGVVAWAITTSDGIIMYDATFDYSVEETVDNGLRKLGLDPADIKYVIVSHGHTDHFGGARHLQDTYGARIILSETDWDLIEQDRAPANLKPRRDIVATDGMEVTLGDTTVRLYITPGHTPGTISALIPLEDGNRSHLGTIWGGNNFGFRYFRDRADAFGTYRAAAARYAETVADARVDVLVTSHLAQDRLKDKINALRFRNPGDPHPFVDLEAPLRHLTILGECAAARLAGDQTGN